LRVFLEHIAGPSCLYCVNRRRQVDSHRLYYCCLEEGVVRVARRGAHPPEDSTPELFPPSLPTSGKPDVGGEASASSACPVVHQALQYSFRDEEGERSCRFQAASGPRTARGTSCPCCATIRCFAIFPRR